MLWILFIIAWLFIVFFACALTHAGAEADRKIEKMLNNKR